MKIGNPAISQAQLNTTTQVSDRKKPISDELNIAAKQQHAQSDMNDDPALVNNQNLHDIEVTSVSVYEPERFAKVSQTLYFGELPSLFRGMQSHYQDFMSELEKSDPELAKLEWSFSIDEGGQLVVNGPISNENKAYLEEKLNENNELVQLAKQVPDVMMKGLAYDRGADGKANAWGKYDVNTENLKNILDFREVLDSTYTERDDISYFKDNFNTFEFAENVASQLKRKAEVKFSY
ncbi:hypothetical protein [Pseudoalteromonas byunsanensis]|uniref:Uncharacterized protein n=1 Tax=Pseudoalteromonas byunsanensis TaxID=327939 RepID=A0A1S1NBZ2_9GAMM|nr:hypothetical protein [Pseudoalteromonas byunsanensis]OHU96909.1 hypothetical protein BIW53_03370 [Pseudoalteromonas byunsanensis]